VRFRRVDIYVCCQKAVVAHIGDKSMTQKMDPESDASVPVDKIIERSSGSTTSRSPGREGGTRVATEHRDGRDGRDAETAGGE
jgi:hypothetical protein